MGNVLLFVANLCLLFEKKIKRVRKRLKCTKHQLLIEKKGKQILTNR